VPIKASKANIISEKPSSVLLSDTTAYPTSAFPSIQESEKNIEEMHFYFVEF
jgi:hypothetical protein